MWYIIPHTKTKISRTHVHACTRADFFFGMYQLETRFARINILGTDGIVATSGIFGTLKRVLLCAAHEVGEVDGYCTWYAGHAQQLYSWTD